MRRRLELGRRGVEGEGEGDEALNLMGRMTGIGFGVLCIENC